MHDTLGKDIRARSTIDFFSCIAERARQKQKGWKWNYLQESFYPLGSRNNKPNKPTKTPHTKGACENPRKSGEICVPSIALSYHLFRLRTELKLFSHLEVLECPHPSESRLLDLRWCLVFRRDILTSFKVCSDCLRREQLLLAVPAMVWQVVFRQVWEVMPRCTLTVAFYIFSTTYIFIRGNGQSKE